MNVLTKDIVYDHLFYSPLNEQVFFNRTIRTILMEACFQELKDILRQSRGFNPVAQDKELHDIYIKFCNKLPSMYKHIRTVKDIVDNNVMTGYAYLPFSDNYSIPVLKSNLKMFIDEERKKFISANINISESNFKRYLQAKSILVVTICYVFGFYRAKFTIDFTNLKANASTRHQRIDPESMKYDNPQFVGKNRKEIQFIVGSGISVRKHTIQFDRSHKINAKFNFNLGTLLLARPRQSVAVLLHEIFHNFTQFIFTDIYDIITSDDKIYQSGRRADEIFADTGPAAFGYAADQTMFLLNISYQYANEIYKKNKKQNPLLSESDLLKLCEQELKQSMLKSLQSEIDKFNKGLPVEEHPKLVMRLNNQYDYLITAKNTVDQDMEKDLIDNINTLHTIFLLFDNSKDDDEFTKVGNKELRFLMRKLIYQRSQQSKIQSKADRAAYTKANPRAIGKRLYEKKKNTRKRFI